MFRRFTSRPALFSFGLLLIGAFCGVTWIRVRQEQRQQRLNRALIHAILHYDTNAALTSLREGADPNTREQPDSPPSVLQEWRALFLRRKPPANDSDPAITLIMDSTVERPKQSLDENGIPRENARLVAALLEKGARVNATSGIHETALKQAASWDYTDTVHILLAHGADVNIAMQGGDTPLMDAALMGNADTVRLLLERGANLNVQDSSGYTALMEAQSYDLPPQIIKSMTAAELQKDHLLPTALKVLLQHHPDFTLKNRKGETALARARKQHQTQKSRLLIQAGAKE